MTTKRWRSEDASASLDGGGGLSLQDWRSWFTPGVAMAATVVIGAAAVLLIVMLVGGSTISDPGRGWPLGSSHPRSSASASDGSDGPAERVETVGSSSSGGRTTRGASR